MNHLSNNAWTLGVVLALCPLFHGCGVTPARSDVPVTPATPLSGRYDATVHTGVTGPITMTMIAQPTEGGIKANTRQGVAWSLVGGLDGVLGPLLAPFLFPSGMIVTWESTLPHDGQPGEGTIGVGTLSSLRVATRMRTLAGPVEMVYKDGRVLGLFSLSPQPSDGPTTHADYAALASAVATTLPTLMYDSHQADSRGTRNYLRDLNAGAGNAQDDLEFLFAAAVAGRSNINAGVPLVFPRRGEAESAKLLASYNALPKPYTVTSDAATGITTLRIDAFVGVNLVDEAFTQALSPPPRGLILDLGTSPGIDLSSLRVLSWLCDHPVDAGMWFDAKARERVLKAPNAALTAAEVWTLRDDTSVAAIEQSLAATGTVRVMVQPRATVFAGPVVLLTTSRTSASSEALACVLVKLGRVTHMGEASAGRPFLSREVDIGQGWGLRANTYDYLPPDGGLIRGKGLKPSRRVGRDDAVKEATKTLVKVIGERRP